MEKMVIVVDPSSCENRMVGKQFDVANNKFLDTACYCRAMQPERVVAIPRSFLNKWCPKIRLGN